MNKLSIKTLAAFALFGFAAINAGEMSKGRSLLRSMVGTTGKTNFEVGMGLLVPSFYTSFLILKKKNPEFMFSAQPVKVSNAGEHLMNAIRHTYHYGAFSPRTGALGLISRLLYVGGLTNLCIAPIKGTYNVTKGAYDLFNENYKIVKIKKSDV